MPSSLRPFPQPGRARRIAERPGAGCRGDEVSTTWA